MKRLTPTESVLLLREAVRLARNFLTAKTANGTPQYLGEPPDYVLRVLDRAYQQTGGVTKRTHEDETPPMFSDQPKGRA